VSTKTNAKEHNLNIQDKVEYEDVWTRKKKKADVDVKESMVVEIGETKQRHIT